MSKNRKPAGFWKIFGASALSSFVIGVIGIILFTSIIALILNNFSDEMERKFSFKKEHKVEDNSVLLLDFKIPVADRSFSSFNRNLFDIDRFIGLNEILVALKEAKEDDRIKGLVLDASELNTGIATTHEIRQAIEDFKSSGKFVYAYGKGYTQKSYYLASVADSVYLYPTGLVEFKGLSVTLSFFKDFLERNNLEVQVIRGSNNKFKSAVEPFLVNEMSDANRKQTEKYVFSIWQSIIEDISVSRGIPAEELEMIADSLMVRNSKDAVEYGLADRLLYPEEFKELIRKESGADNNRETPVMRISHYVKREDRKPDTYVENMFPDIAVIYASGDIHGGKSGPGSVGDETLVKAINEANEDLFVKAIVLRVNSPGGSALASDLIWDALNKVDKPVVVSMGDVAASGGYYISCMADKIFCDPMTITGSIGVFMVIPNIGAFMESDLGIHFSRVKTSQHADMSYLESSFSSFTRPLTEKEKKILQQGVDETYKDFLVRVEEGRRTFTSTAEIDSIGQGRVWSGTDALSIGLTDTIGGLSDAIIYAASLVDINDPKVTAYPKYELGGLEKLLEIMNKEDVSVLMNNDPIVPDFLMDRVHEIGTLNHLGERMSRLIWRIEVE